MSSFSHRLRIACCTALLAVLCSCSAQDVRDPRVHAIDGLAVVGDEQSTEQLVDALDDESESVRRAALTSLENTLKRRIYFDPAAPDDQRERQLAEVRALWENFKERDLLEVAKERMPIQFFYDLNTGELFEARAGMAPIETKSGPYGDMPAGVRAVVFACEGCDKDRYVAWLQTPIVELERYGVAYDADGTSAQRKPTDLAIRSPDGGEWVALGGPSSKQITLTARRCADRDLPLFCRPGR